MKKKKKKISSLLKIPRPHRDGAQGRVAGQNRGTVCLLGSPQVPRHTPISGCYRGGGLSYERGTPVIVMFRRALGCEGAQISLDRGEPYPTVPYALKSRAPTG